MIRLSVAIATFNEEQNIGRCLDSIKDLVDEIIIVDGSSSDKTVEIAKQFGAKVTIAQNYPNFHINKQKSFDLATGEWILYLDADEVVPKNLVNEIAKIIELKSQELEDYQQNLKQKRLFLRHQHLLEQRDGQIGTTKGEYVAFFFPRLNFFLGVFLKYGGVYPDGVIRLFKKGKAYLPGKDVHEQMVVKGRVGWLENNLLHYDSPTFGRYIMRNNRYVKLLASQMATQRLGKTPIVFFNYLLIKPLSWFLITQVRHKGILDGPAGIIFSFFSALRFPRAYLLYLFNKS